MGFLPFVAIIHIAVAGTQKLVLNAGDFSLSGGASIIPGHGAPTGVSLRTGNPGQVGQATFPRGAVLTPGSNVTSVSFAYRYVTGYESAPSGLGANFSLSINQEPATSVRLYSSPHLTEYAYSHNQSNYSKPLLGQWSGNFAVAAASVGSTLMQLTFQNNDRNLQILLPLIINVTCVGASECFVSAKPTPTPTPPSPPPTPPPPKSLKPWTSIGPMNIGDDIYGHGEAGTIAPAVSVVSNPKLIYMGGNNNAAASGVLKSIDYGIHWAKMNNGLFDTRLYGLFIVDDVGDHVLAGTPSGVFETMDGAQTWVHVPQTQAWGVANSFRNGTINGKPVIFIGANAGLGNVPLVKESPLINKTWSLIPSPRGSAAWRTNVVSVADFDGNGKPLQNSVLAGCLWVGGHGVVHILSVVNETNAQWDVQVQHPCQSIAMDPNNADHIIVNNASNGAHVYESNDGGKTYHSCLDRRGAVMVAVDRKGWFYTGSEAGAFVNRNGCGTNGSWEVYIVRRHWRRMNRTVDRSAHDYQRINIDFAGGVAFGSDQGMFIQNGTEMILYSANGDVNNNIIMHPAITEAETPGDTCIVTALWDWSPVASWDSGRHWPSWQTPDDGASMGYFGEGGGCFGVGKSKYALCMHHHNVAFSSRCGKNMSRFVVPNGASVGPPSFSIKEGTRSEPDGGVYALMSMGLPPWTTISDKALTCNSSTSRGDLGVHNKSYTCLSQVDFGDEYNWYGGANVAVWRGDSDKHCYICRLTGNQSSWDLFDAKGAVVFALDPNVKRQPNLPDKPKEDGDGVYRTGGDLAEARMWHKFKKHVQKAKSLELGGTEPRIPSAFDLSSTGNPMWILKSWNFGANWTYLPLPQFLQGLGGFHFDPTNSSTMYGVANNCISRSYDKGETWQPCWQANGLVGSFKQIVIRNSTTMIVMRNNAVPLRTFDGGKTWTELKSVANLARYSPGAAYSWSGKTLAISTVVGRTVVWISTDDGDTWIDESADYTALTGGIAQWYDNTLYICSLGQGISAKVFTENY